MPQTGTRLIKNVSKQRKHSDSSESFDQPYVKYLVVPVDIFFLNRCFIKDKRLRTLLSKGPKYRLPSLIDFDSCRSHIAEAIQNYSVKWCNREHAEQNSLTDWKKRVFEIVDTRIAFYKSNTHLLPPKPRLSYRHLKKAIQEFHSKFVFVPADKASNNIIIV